MKRGEACASSRGTFCKGLAQRVPGGQSEIETSHPLGTTRLCSESSATTGSIRPLADVTRDKIKARHKRHGSERSEARANNAVRVLRALFNYAAISPNPAASPKRRQSGEAGGFLYDVGRKRTLIHPHDMPMWWEAVVGLSGKRKDSGASAASDLLQLLLLTGLRAGEACGLEWKHVDTRANIITIPDTKNGDPHSLPLGVLLGAAINRRLAAQVGPFVFPAKESPKKPYSYSVLRGWFDVVAAESGVRVTAHDCRRTFATIAESLDISSSTVKRLLNHRSGRADVTEGYIVPSPERLRGAMQRIETEVLRLASAGGTHD